MNLLKAGWVQSERMFDVVTRPTSRQEHRLPSASEVLTYCVIYHVCHLFWFPFILIFLFILFNEKLYRLLKSWYFFRNTLVVTEYAYSIPEKCIVFVFAYMALVKYLPIFKMAAVVNLYQQISMLTGVRLQAHIESMRLAEAMIKII